MLRNADKRLHVGDLLADVLHGQSAAEPPVAGYNGWWDATRAGSFTIVSDRISQWDDLGPNGYHWTQGTAGNRPRYGTRVETNGVVVPHFDNSPCYMEGNLPRSDRTCTTFAVVQSDFFLPSVTVMQLISASNSGGNHFRAGSLAGGPVVQTATHAAVLSQTDATFLSAGRTYVIAQVLTATDITHYINAASETDANATAFTAGRTARLGYNYLNTEPFRGTIAEIISYDSTLASGDVDTVIAWLMAKWNVS